MKLEEQLERLAPLGLSLDPGVGVDDLIYSFDRKDYEEQPFDLILFVLGFEVEREPWDRAVCSRVWNFDTECIAETGDYAKIARRLCRVAGKPDAFANIKDHVDIEKGEAWLDYEIDGQHRHIKAVVKNDWADPAVICQIFSDLESDSHRFYQIDNGQAAVLYYLDAPTAKALQELSRHKLR